MAALSHYSRCIVARNARFLSSVPPKRINFDDVRLSFKSKSNAEILRALTVFRLCTVSPLVKNSLQLFNASTSILGNNITNTVMKKTFFGHFCAGEDENDIKPTIARLHASGLGAILDYAAEADLGSAGGEDLFDKNAQISLSCIETTGKSVDGFAAIKLTALCPTSLLEHLTNVLVRTQQLFKDFARIEQPQGETEYLKRRLTLKQLETGLAAINVSLPQEKIVRLFHKMDLDKSGEIDFLDWITFLDPQVLGGLNPKFKSQGLPTLSEEDMKALEAMLKRLNMLAAAASKLKVRLMVDAEQTYFQPAIDHLILYLQRRYNVDFPVVWNTYQCYLKDTENRVRVDQQRSDREKFRLAAKVVRGAYMIQEREKASKNNYPSPIHDSKAQTDAAYHRVVEMMIRHPGSELMVASHNESSIRFTIEKMAELQLSNRGSGVFFGQLFGMCDHVSYALGYNGYAVYKYVPYGPIKDVLPYLVRRAQENGDVLSNSGKERGLLWKELVRRLTNS